MKSVRRVYLDRCCLPLLAACLAVPSTVSAQAAPAPIGSPAPAATPADSSGRMTLDVLVTDKQGTILQGLEQKDFTLLDNGQPHPIMGFRAIDAQANPNAVQVVIAVDMINTNFNRVAYERAQLGEFLNQNGGKLAHPARLAVLTETGLKMMQGSTTDGHALLAEFVKVGTDLRTVRSSAGFYGAAERIEYSLTELRQLVAHEATQPGHKLIILLGPGWPMLTMAGVEEIPSQRNWVFNVLTQITDEIQRAHVSIYSVYPFDLGRTNPFFYRVYLKPVRRPDQGEYPDLALQVLAHHSGGRAIIMGRDVCGQINTAMLDAGSYYELTFETTPGGKPNEYHDLDVKVDQAGALARTDAGYYANIQLVGGKTASPSHSTRP